MNPAERANWEARHRTAQPAGDPEPFVVQMMPRITRGLALDVAAGGGRHAIALARAGFTVIAADYSEPAMRALAIHARAAHLAIWPVVADLDRFDPGAAAFDAIINVNFLDRALFPRFLRALRAGGVLLADTFLIEQARLGHPHDPRFMLAHGELRALVAGLEIEEYQEGRVDYPDGSYAFRASVLARKPGGAT